MERYGTAHKRYGTHEDAKIGNASLREHREQQPSSARKTGFVYAGALVCRVVGRNGWNRCVVCVLARVCVFPYCLLLLLLWHNVFLLLGPLYRLSFSLFLLFRFFHIFCSLFIYFSVIIIKPQKSDAHTVAHQQHFIHDMPHNRHTHRIIIGNIQTKSTIWQTACHSKNIADSHTLHNIYVYTRARYEHADS